MKTKIEFETFREIGSYQINDLIQKNPSCFNSEIRVKKYKIIVEEIEEPDSIIRERIKKLWDECDNWHHWEPLKKYAKKYNLELNNRR